MLRAMTMNNRAQQPAGPRGTILYKGRARGITVSEACRIQGFDEYFLEGLDDKFATELIGEAVCTRTTCGKHLGGGDGGYYKIACENAKAACRRWSC